MGRLDELSPAQVEKVVEEDFRVSSGIKRLPDDTKARPSTYEG